MSEAAVLTDIILEKLTTIFVIVNNNGNIEFVGPSVTRILGFTPDELLGQGWWELTRGTEEQRDTDKKHVRSLFNTDASGSFESYLRTQANGRKWILWHYSQGPDNTLIAMGHDITERKLAEQQLQLKNKELTAKNTEIIDSIKYATRIQKAILPEISAMKRSLADAFVLYKPKDLVSGDLYWHYEKGDKVFIAAIDCTGHGVPGALMSIIANSLLRDIIVKRGIEEPSEVLHLVDEELMIALSKEDETASDGMDIALCVFDKSTDMLAYSGAFRPLLLLRDNVITEYRGNRYPIGFYQDVKKEFKTEHISLQKDDHLYIFSDGYSDQFGGELGKKLNKVRFKELLLTAQSMEMEEQEAFLEYALLNWQQDIEQTDDVVVIGMKY